MAIVVVSYRYSMSVDRALTEEASWNGRVPGRSLATVMSELRRQHCWATNILIVHVEWRDEAGAAEGAPERRGGPAGRRDGPPGMAVA